MVIYDVTDDNLRSQIASFLTSKGLRRVQWSAFLGELTSSQLREVESGLLSLVRRKAKEGERANVQIFPMTEAQVRNRVVIDGSSGKGGGEGKEEGRVLI